MDRRGFLKTLGVATVAAASGLWNYELDLDRALWVPGKKKVFDLWHEPHITDYTLTITPGMLYEMNTTPVMLQAFKERHLQYWNKHLQAWEHVPVKASEEAMSKLARAALDHNPQNWRVVFA